MPEGLKLVWADSRGQNHEARLDGRELILGRAPECDLVLDFGFVSSRHARLFFAGDQLWIQDLESTNGTFLNGKPIQQSDVLPGDRVSLGELELQVVLVAGATALDRTILETMVVDDMDFTAVLGLQSGAQSELEKISMLLDFQFKWEQEFSAEGMLQQILRSALKISGAERGCILTKQDGPYEFRTGLDAKLSVLTESEFQTSRSIVQMVSENLEAVFMTQGLEGGLTSQESIVAMDLRAVACIPLLSEGETRGEAHDWGILYLDSQRHMHMLSGLDEKLLRRLAFEASHLLEKLSLLEEVEDKKRIESELVLATETQEGLLPGESPAIPGYGVHASSRPTRYVSGDFYDFHRFGDGSFTSVLADVSGKGVPASLLGASAQGALQILVRERGELNQSTERLNRYLCERSEEGRFLTMFQCELDAHGSGTYVSAGHNPIYLYKSDGREIETLWTGDLILGFMPDTKYRTVPFQMDRGDLLLIYSDGLSEAENSQGDMFGEDHIQSILLAFGEQGLVVVEHELAGALDQFTAGAPQNDDITLILIERE